MATLNNLITGTANDEELIGTTGNDLIFSNGGDDILRGGLGNDTYYILKTKIYSGSILIDELGGDGIDTIAIYEDVRTNSNSNITNVVEKFITNSDNSISLKTSYIENEINKNSSLTLKGEFEFIRDYGIGDWGSFDVLAKIWHTIAPNISNDFQLTVGLGTVENDHMIGSEIEDHIFCFAGDDIIYGAGGTDYIDAGDGTDTCLYSGSAAFFTISYDHGPIFVNNRQINNGEDRLISVEKLSFSDFSINLSTLEKSANLNSMEIASLVELYIASFNRAPDSVGLDYWGSRFYDSIHNIENGMTLDQIAKSFFVQTETMAAYPTSMAVRDFVTTVYNNVLSRGPDDVGLNYWVGELNKGNVSKDSFLLAIINGAKAITGGAEDRQTLANKTDVGMYYALEKGLNNYTDWAKDVMSGVNSNASSVTDANAKTDHYAVLATDPATSDLVVKLVGVYEG